VQFLKISVEGWYPLDKCPERVLEALRAEIQKHMEGYGFTRVRTEPWEAVEWRPLPEREPC